MNLRMLRSWSASAMDSSLPLAHALGAHAGQIRREVGAVFDEPFQAPLEVRQLVQHSGSSVSTANSGISPTMERIFMGNCVAVGQLEHVVEEAVFFVPQSHAARRRDGSWRGRCR